MSENKPNYSKIALLISIISILLITILHVKVESGTISVRDYYECPGVGIQPSHRVNGHGCTRFCFTGCTFSHTVREDGLYIKIKIMSHK